MGSLCLLLALASGPGIIFPNGVTNAASFQSGPVAPGEAITIFGTNLGPATAAVASYGADRALPQTLGGTRVLFGERPAAMIYASAGQVSAIVPYDVSLTTSIRVEYDGEATAPYPVAVVNSAPALFRCPGETRPLMVNYSTSDGTPRINCSTGFETPVAGSIVSLYVTGEGATAPSIATGTLPTGPGYPAPVYPVEVLFAGIPAEPCAHSFAGLVWPGVTQLNLCVPGGVAALAQAPVTVRTAGKLIWADEFNAAAGTPPDVKNWVYDTGAGGWGNEELQTYTRATENVSHDGQGNLMIRALRTGANSYTSARVKTKGLQEFTYGRIEARIKLPFGQGIWPAFWMLGANIDAVDWPRCGEIDVMEYIGKEPTTVYGTVLGPGPGGEHVSAGGKTNLASGRLADEFHVYSAEWTKDSIKFFVDGVMYYEATRDKLPAGSPWVFEHPHFILLNLAVGGRWPGYPDSSTQFPQTLLVDWVRVYQ